MNDEKEMKKKRQASEGAEPRQQSDKSPEVLVEEDVFYSEITPTTLGEDTDEERPQSSEEKRGKKERNVEEG